MLVTLKGLRVLKGELKVRFLKLVGYVAKAIEEELFYPSVHNVLCNPRACGYWSRCAEEF